MKTIKQTLFVFAGSLAATCSFAQVNLGVTNTTHAAVQNSVNVTKATQATTATTSATKATVSTAATKTSDVKTKTVSAADRGAQSIDANASVKAGTNVNGSSSA